MPLHAPDRHTRAPWNYTTLRDSPLVCRTFLQRASTTQPAARARLGAQLAAQVEPFVSPPPPWGTHPERFLAAVLVERRDRELFLGLRDRRSDDDARRSLERLPHEIGATA